MPAGLLITWPLPLPVSATVRVPLSKAPEAEVNVTPGGRAKLSVPMELQVSAALPAGAPLAWQAALSTAPIEAVLVPLGTENVALNTTCDGLLSVTEIES